MSWSMCLLDHRVQVFEPPGSGRGVMPVCFKNLVGHAGCSSPPQGRRCWCMRGQTIAFGILWLTQAGEWWQVWTMPRKPRVQYPGAIYHVVSRGVLREAIFVNDVDRHDFLRTLPESGLRRGGGRKPVGTSRITRREPAGQKEQKRKKQRFHISGCPIICVSQPTDKAILRWDPCP